ncbi:SDR family NAD(P)-dependent oxidoreductase [Colwellia sp. 12G3]|uniref:SDR family NAD(P)-dependent oxidoreductase n=1 Tax=Colwellia sp. 12G3 TaxID=2058299 RepID=UPI000C32E7EE|nr:SDR family NAD(P)-dependent oxidoreductase [Colwellia sp. 12G3]PKI16650.1 short-chain dehydrogenase [Colwellia sp. 12G3]
MSAKHILINGASSGIGAVLAKLLAAQGHKLSLCGRSATKLSSVINSLPTSSLPSGSLVHSESFCVSDHSRIAQFCQQASEKLNVDVIINCVGINQSRESAVGVAKDTLDWHMQINCYAPIEFINQLAPSMQSHKAGVILNVLSTVCLFSNPGIAVYSATKAALDSFTKVMRKELRSDNIKVLSIYPGGVDTDFREAQRPNYLSAEDVADAIATMLSTSDKAHIHELVIRPAIEDNY